MEEGPCDRDAATAGDYDGEGRGGEEISGVGRSVRAVDAECEG